MGFWDREIKMSEDTYRSVTGTAGEDHAFFVNKQLVENGEDKDWEVVAATDTTLMLDYDTPSMVTISDRFMTTLEVLKQRISTVEADLYEDVDWRMYHSRSGNIHVIVKLPFDMSELERIAWQGAFGSDPKREALHLLSLQRGDVNSILLVMRKDRAKF